MSVGKLIETFIPVRSIRPLQLSTYRVSSNVNKLRFSALVLHLTSVYDYHLKVINYFEIAFALGVRGGLI